MKKKENEWREREREREREKENRAKRGRNEQGALTNSTGERLFYGYLRQ